MLSTSFKRSFVLAAAALAAAFCELPAHAQVSLTAIGTAYTQNFDTLANTGTSNAVPAGWAFLDTGSGTLGLYSTGTGSSATGDVYSFGVAASTDRAFGSLGSGTTAANKIGASFTNNTGSTITSLDISFTTEEWRRGDTAQDVLAFSYGLTATGLNTGSFTSFAALNAVSVAGCTGSGNGNTAACRATVSSSITGLSIAPGSTFWIRWEDSNSSGNDDGLAIDDFSLTPNAAPVSTNPTATGSASPNPVTAGQSTTLSATVTPGTNPPSTSLTVNCDLTAIGGANPFSLPSPGFSAPYTVPAATTAQPYTLPCIVADQSRSSNFSIALTVNGSSVPPSGTGSANPNSLQAGASTLLTVNVTVGTNAISTVKADLTSIGGSATQTLLDDGVPPDAASGDHIYSFSATVVSGTAPGLKSLPVTITDTSSLTGGTTISLTVQPSPAPTTVKISQVYGGGGNSGTTYKNDFIELYNQSASTVDISQWSVQQTSATGTTWNVTPLCAPAGSCTIQPGHYYLVQEAAGAGGTTSLPAADITGAAIMGNDSGKVALVNNGTALSGACPVSAGIADLVGYGTAANCSETAPTATLDNQKAAVRKGNGCIDTDNNFNDFVAIGPIPRNSTAPQNICGGNPAVPSGVGTADPASLEATATTLLLVTVSPATSPASTGITVTGDLTSIGGSASQQFFDDGTHGDETPGDNVFTFRATAPLTTGAKYIPTTISDAQFRTAPAPITITVSSPTCGVERWSVKTGTDPDANLVNLGSPVRASINTLRGIPAPADPPGPPLNARVAPTETTVYVVNGLMTLYKREDDVDYHVVLQDPAGRTIITEIPSPACDGTNSPFDALVASVRAKFDNRLTATKLFQTANLPVQMKGVGFFDFIHGQTGVAPNGIELHPLLDLTFTTASTTGLGSSLNPSTLNQQVTFTATVSSAAGTPTGNVSFFDGANLLGTGALNGSGQATFATSALTAGAHSITASYEGDSLIAESASAALVQQVKITPVVTWAHPAAITFGSALGNGQLNATANVPGSFVYNPPAGTVLPVGNGQVLSTTFTPADTTNYNTAPGSTTIDVLPAPPATGPSLGVTRVLSRDGSNNVVVQLTVTNSGGTAAANVMLTSLKVGTINAPGLPIAMGTIAAGASATVTVNMGNPVGAAGASSSLTAGGTYTGGTFSASSRITLP